MICRLYELEIDTEFLKFEKSSQKTDDCGYCHSSSCRFCSDVDIPLVDGVKFGWTLSMKLTIPTDSIINEKYKKCKSAIKLIHPVSLCIWIITGLDVDGNDAHWIFHKNKFAKYKGLQEINKQLKEKHEFNGRDITSEDFERDVDESNN